MGSEECKGGATRREVNMKGGNDWAPFFQGLREGFRLAWLGRRDYGCEGCTPQGAVYFYIPRNSKLMSNRSVINVRYASDLAPS